MPGFVDTHIHAPQYVNSGTGYDVMLLEWLRKYTFPTEAHFKDLEFATDVYTKAVVSEREKVKRERERERDRGRERGVSERGGGGEYIV